MPSKYKYAATYLTTDNADSLISLGARAVYIYLILVAWAHRGDGYVRCSNTKISARIKKEFEVTIDRKDIGKSINALAGIGRLQISKEGSGRWLKVVNPQGGQPAAPVPSAPPSPSSTGRRKKAGFAKVAALIEEGGHASR